MPGARHESLATCAYAGLAQGVMKVWQAKAAQGAGEPGTVLLADPKAGLIIATGNGAMELTQIQAPNGKRMDAKAYLLGHPIKAGKPLDEVKA